MPTGPGRLAFEGFDWDRGNIEKCRKHGLDRVSVEQVFANAPAIYDDPKHSGAEARFRAIGSDSGGRGVFVAFTLRSRGEVTLVRPISARYMHAREVQNYEEAAAADEQ